MPADAPILGSLIGVYRIDAMLGAGGMGEVYRARDTRLGRDVAVKILPTVFAEDPDRLARFEREARILATLNHPNIAGIHGIEETTTRRALILELVEGETLSERLARGPIPVADAVGLATQIATALEAAHDKAIVHRDLKPANVKVKPDGTVKVLDFGLAKLASARPDAEQAALPTVTLVGTRDGAFMGTVPYMSPEQARGNAVDKRTDIWSFGCVLFEMLTGRGPFARETTADTISAILERDPDWSLLPGTTPESIRNVLKQCLAKSLQERTRDIGDARLALARDSEPGVATRRPRAGTAALRTLGTRGVVWRSLLGLALLVAAIAAIVATRGIRSPATIVEPPVQVTDFNDSAVAPSLSHDGRMLTFVRGAEFGRTAPTRGQIYVKLLPNGQPVQLTRDQGGGYPAFSADDAHITYTVVMPGLKWDTWQVPVLGGAPQAFLPNASGLVWLNDQRLVYAAIKSGLHMGIVTSTPSKADLREIYYPAGPGGMAHRANPSADGKSLLVVEMDEGTWQPCRLVPTDQSSNGRPVGPRNGQCTSAAWSPDGRWMYFSSNAGGAYHIWRQRYPDGVPEQITFGPLEQEGTAITPDGKFLITSMGLQRATIWLHDATGDRALTDEGYAIQPTMTASGRRVFYVMRTALSRGTASGELWSVDLNTGQRERVVPGLVMTNYSLSPDESKVVFTSAGNASGDGIWLADVDRRNPPRLIQQGPDIRAFFGRSGEIIYMGGDKYLYRISEDGPANTRISPEQIVYLITVSPDGRWASVIMPRTTSGGGTRLEFRSLRGEPSVPVCNEDCGIGPRSLLEVLPFNWSADGKWLFVNLIHLGKGTRRTVAVPYRSDLPQERLWPNGLRTEAAIMTTPGARIINAAVTFPAGDSEAYLFWRSSFQSNLYRIRLPE